MPYPYHFELLGIELVMKLHALVLCKGPTIDVDEAIQDSARSRQTSSQKSNATTDAVSTSKGWQNTMILSYNGPPHIPFDALSRKVLQSWDSILKVQTTGSPTQSSRLHRFG
eukprot:6488416-Amphidinium_carterae.1